MSQQKYPEKVLPGQPILPIYEATENSNSIKYIAGENAQLETIKFDNSQIPTIVSTALGRVEINDFVDESGNNDAHIKVVNVITRKDSRYLQSNTEYENVRSRSYKAVTPKVNDVVLARVNKLNQTRVNVEILSVLSIDSESTSAYDDEFKLLNLLPTETGEFFKATIRSQDIRSTERDSVKTWECYQPGDIIRAIVISLGDGASFYLSTARNDLGVVFSRHNNGELMYPLDWETMIEPGTGEIEKRKCAKPL